jgi:hypothetical protein
MRTGALEPGPVEDWHTMTSWVMLKVQSQAQRVNMWPGSHVVTPVTLVQLETHLCDWCHIFVMSSVTGDTTCI